MMSLQIYRVIADDREREVRDLMRVRGLIASQRSDRATAQPGRHQPKARAR
jgi:DNA-binding transcriptional regulator of glucitol operon